MGQKKYKLFSTKDGAPKICAFYFSEEGCKNESNCKFLHVKPGEEPISKSSDGKKKKKNCQQVQPVITNSDISSESGSDSDSDSDSDCPPPQQQPPSTNNTPNNTPNKKKNDPTPKNKKKKDTTNKVNDDSLFHKQREFKRKPTPEPNQPIMPTRSIQQEQSLFLDPKQQKEDYQPKENNRDERRKQKRKEYEEDQLQQQKQNSNKKKKKNKESPYKPTFLNPGPAMVSFASMATSPPPQQQPVQQQQKAKKSKTPPPTAALGTFASMATSLPPQQQPMQQQQKAKKSKKSKTPPPKALGTFASMAAPAPQQQQPIDFRSMNLPIASFSAMPNNTNNTPNKVFDDSSSEEEGEITESSSEEEEEIIVRHEEYNKWKLCIDETKKHQKYASQYGNNIQEIKENLSNHSTPLQWVIPKVYNPSEHLNLPQVIAIDCEMCRTQNPKNRNDQDSRALCRISIINGNNPKDDVLLDTLVKPVWPIIDDVSFIHGITSKHLENVQFTMAHVQAFLSSLCTTETIIIGHGLINDFLSMRLDYSVLNNIVDTAFLYKVAYPNPTEEQLQERQTNPALPSLQNLANTILTKDMPDIHDSVNDAQTAFYAANYYRIQNGDVPNIIKTASSKKHKRNYNGSSNKSSDSNTLFLHRLPKSCSTENINQLFHIHTSIITKNVQPINFNEATGVGKTYVIFTTDNHANLAFDSFAGDCVKDASGRNQKRIYLKGGGYVCVRKMVMDDSDDDNDDDDSSSTSDGEIEM